MARIPESELDRLKREVSLVRLVESSGIDLKQHGKDYLGLCAYSRASGRAFHSKPATDST